MKVRMLVSILGTRDGQSWPPRGGEIDLPDGEAEQMCAVGYCVPASTPVRKPARRGVLTSTYDDETGAIA